MVTGFDDLALLEHIDPVRVDDGAEPVRNGDCGSVVRKLVKGGLNFPFIFSV